jgi:EAL domain-containing protein (putative c-di-GMP-specific phosphodiesterase class I)
MSATTGCTGCSTPLDFDVSMAFQPIVDINERSIFAYEALVRGLDGEPAGEVLAQVTPENKYAFDQLCRVRAIELAAALGMSTRLSVNFMPNAVYEPHRCLRTTLEAAIRCGFPLDRIILETTEDERITDPSMLKQIFLAYRREGFMTAIDDFGAGYAGLNLLADFQPDIVKLDMRLVRDIHADRARQAIVGAIAAIGGLLGICIVAEGVEQPQELAVLKHLGINLMQGYLFAKPTLAALAEPDFSILDNLPRVVNG